MKREDQRIGGREPAEVLGVVGEPLNGVGYLRFEQPFRYLGPMGYRLRTLGRSIELKPIPGGYAPSESLLDGVSAVLFPQMVASPRLADGGRVETVGPVCERAARRGLKIIYSVDDYLARIDRHNPGYEVIAESIDNLKTILDHADAILVTTPRLRDALADLGKPTRLLPNAIEPSRWTPRPRTAQQPRVGWAGSSSHIRDLLMVLPAIRRLQRRTECRFFLFGLVDRPLEEEVPRVRSLLPGLSPSQRETADGFLELAGALGDVDHVHRPFGSIDSFFEVLPRLDLDVGICPLLDNEFNVHKSAVKFYEYAAAGTMTVASAVGPYADEVSVTVPNDEIAWADALERHLRDPAARERELTTQRRFVYAERNIETLCHRWADALDEILAGPSAAAAGSGGVG